MYKIFTFPALVSLAICAFSTFFSAVFLNGILKRFIDQNTSLFLTFLFLLLPSVQIFYLANLYAIVTTIFLRIIYFYFCTNPKISIFGIIVCFFLASFLTFIFIFMVILLFCFEVIKSKKVKNLYKLIIASISVVFIYLVLLIVFRFNYVNSFLIASTLENPNGFLLFIDQIGYFFTREEDILEILIFFGPFLFILFIKGLPILKKKVPELYLLTVLALTILLTFFLMSVYRTGKTARGCLYIYPFLLFPIGVYLKKINLSQTEQVRLLILVFVQTIIM